LPKLLKSLTASSQNIARFFRDFQERILESVLQYSASWFEYGVVKKRQTAGSWRTFNSLKNELPKISFARAGKQGKIVRFLTNAPDDARLVQVILRHLHFHAVAGR